MNATQASTRRKKRRWLVLPVLALLIAGGVVAYRISLGPQLQPAARYHWPDYHGCPLIFSAQGMGYPAIGIVDEKKPGGITISQPYILDDLCRPLEATESRANVSPTRAVIAWVDQNGPKPRFCFRRRDGRRAYVPCPTFTVDGSTGPLPYSDTLVSYYSVGHERVWLYTPDGVSLSPPPMIKDRIIPNNIACADERLFPFSDDCLHLQLYDRTLNRTVLTAHYPMDLPETIWRHQDRLLMVSRQGHALVYDGVTQVASILPGAAGWRWCEDGTVWTLIGGKLRVLHWRTGRPKLVTMTTHGTPGARYGSLAPGLHFRENTDSDWAAVWGDGRLVASVESLTPAESRLVQTATRLSEWLGIPMRVPRETRRLTLYRNHRRVGSFLLRTQPKPPPPTALPTPPAAATRPWLSRTDNHEHLAFTADGQYLSWAIDDGTGVRLFVFKVPPP